MGSESVRHDVSGIRGGSDYVGGGMSKAHLRHYKNCDGKRFLGIRCKLHAGVVFHLQMTDDHDKVTCSRCLKKIRGAL